MALPVSIPALRKQDASEREPNDADGNVDEEDPLQESRSVRIPPNRALAAAPKPPKTSA
jgi:hypothetical protein